MEPQKEDSLNAVFCAIFIYSAISTISKLQNYTLYIPCIRNRAMGGLYCRIESEENKVG